jgi:hypothetical protein
VDTTETDYEKICSDFVEFCYEDGDRLMDESLEHYKTNTPEEIKEALISVLTAQKIKGEELSPIYEYALEEVDLFIKTQQVKTLKKSSTNKKTTEKKRNAS